MGYETEMDSQKPEDIDDRVLEEVPEDVAVLYSWANLKGARYRDFSASRREFRAQMRKRAAEAQREAEIRLKEEAEASAAAAERASQEAAEAARFHQSEARRAAEEYRQHDSHVQQQAHARALENAEELSRRAAAERLEAARRAEAIAAVEAAAQREAREMAEARASAERQATRYAESEARRRAMAGPQPAAPFIPGLMSDPYMDHHVATPPPERVYHTPVLAEEDMMAGRLPRVREEKVAVPRSEDSGALRAERAYWERLHEQREAGEAAHKARGGQADFYYEPDSEERVAAVDEYAQSAPYRAAPSAPPVYLYKVPTHAPEPAVTEPAAPSIPFSEARAAEDHVPPVVQVPETFAESLPAEPDMPAWLNPPAGPFASAPEPVAETISRPVPPPAPDTLQSSRERVAARWYALKGIMDHGTPGPRGETVLPRSHDSRTPLTAVFSISGGVGKTSMVAALGRALSSLGEHVLLADTTLHGLLQFYFGASELRPGVVRTFSPRPGTNHAPIALVSYDVLSKPGDAASERWLQNELAHSSQDKQRLLLDLTPASPWVVRQLARLNTQILVPVSPDMNSVISLGNVDRFFAGMTDRDGNPVRPVFVLNGFDASLPLHLDVREVMQQQLGDRLLPFVVRRSPAVAEALAEGMTVLDYAPESAVAGDYMDLASWLRSQSLPADAGPKQARWSER